MTETHWPLSQRRLRVNPFVREMLRTVRVSQEALMQPLFAVDGISSPEALPSMRGVFRETSDSLMRTVESDLEAGVRKFLLFGWPAQKAENGFQLDFTLKQIQRVKEKFGKDLFLAVDVCLCNYTSHGHCGLLSAERDHVVNNASVHELAKMGLQYAQAGADCLAPSDMLDGRVGAIRKVLDLNGLEQTLVMSYSAKFHSRFYGPFRLAGDCSPSRSQDCQLRDRATYQIDPGNPNDAYQSSMRDVQEGADILMVKPGMPYLDVLYQLSNEIKLPWAVYEVSGEYGGIELLAEHGLMDRAKAHVEAWTAFTRAGASIIITYGARYAREFLKEAAL